MKHNTTFFLRKSGFLNRDGIPENQTIYTLSSSQQDAVQRALDAASDATGIQFERATVDSNNTLGVIDDEPELYIYFTDLDATGWGLPNIRFIMSRSALKYINLMGLMIRSISYEMWTWMVTSLLMMIIYILIFSGSWEYETLLHEIGHFLGLNHPHEDPVLDPWLDNNMNTVMTYNHGGNYVSDYAPLDKVALEYLYGGDGIGGQYGYFQTSTLDPNIEATVTGMEIFGSTLSGNDFNFMDLGEEDPLSYQISKSEAFIVGSGISAGPSLTIDDSNGTTLISQLEDIPVLTWWHDYYDQDGVYQSATALTSSSEGQGYTISHSDIGNFLSYSIWFVDDDYNIELGASQSIYVTGHIDDPSNSRAQFTQQVSGTFAVGEVLTANVSASDSDGLQSSTGYWNSWYSSATGDGNDYVFLGYGDTYTVTADDLDDQIYLRSGFIDDISTFEYSDYFLAAQAASAPSVTYNSMNVSGWNPDDLVVIRILFC